jgi:hypothetical protein
MIVVWPPKMQAIGMIIDVLRARRMKLNNTFLFVPKEVFDEAHFLPIRRAPGR